MALLCADRWAHKAVSLLSPQSSPVPNVGVVGPLCAQGAGRRILTHDFVHKTHLHIFDFYYPSSLSDWWMDDWISHVYGKGEYSTMYVTCSYVDRYYALLTAYSMQSKIRNLTMLALLNKKK